WKWVIHAVGEDRANDSSGLYTQPSWPLHLLFQAPTKAFTTSGVTTTYYRNIFEPPAAAYVGSTLWITFGTGERGAIGFNDDYNGDGTPNDHTGEENRYYAITDSDPFGSGGTPLIITEASSSGSCANGDSAFTCTINNITSSGSPG